MNRSVVVRLVSLILAVATCNCSLLTKNTTDDRGEFGTKIIGGRAVNLGEAPYMASLRSLADRHFCGGVIVSTRYILTSASCTAGRAATGIRVVVGTVTLSAGGAAHISSSIINYPGFNVFTLVNDISLVYTSTAIAITYAVQTIALSPSIINDREAQVFGWGMYTTTGGQEINYLQVLPTNTMSNEECTLKQTESNAARVTDSKICASSGMGKGPCYGDAGGPLIALQEIEFQPAIPILIGIVSWQVPCAAGFPDVYERISPYYLWIKSYI